MNCKKYYVLFDGRRRFIKLYSQEEAKKAVKANGWKIIRTI